MCVDSGEAGWSCCSSWPSASRKESTDLLLRRNGVRRRKLLGELGIWKRALWEGTTVSPGDSQGGTLDRMLGSRSSSGENTGLSIPKRKGSWSTSKKYSRGQEEAGWIGSVLGNCVNSYCGYHLQGNLDGQTYISNHHPTPPFSQVWPALPDILATCPGKIFWWRRLYLQD